MPANSAHKSVTLAIHTSTFSELGVYATKNKTTLYEIYENAIVNYLNEFTPGRLKIYAAPGAGKRIRVNLDDEVYCRLMEKSGASGHNLSDIIYTALELFLNKDLAAIAA